MTSPGNTGSEKEPHGEKIEAAKTPELSSLLQSLGALRASIYNNEPLDEHDVEAIKRQASEVRVQMGETSYLLTEAKNDPNVGIWLEMLAGDFDRSEELTELPAFIIRDVPDIPDVRRRIILYPHGEWHCPKLKAFSLEAAKALAARGNTIVLKMNTDISYETAHFLADNNILIRNAQPAREVLELTPTWTHAMFHALQNYTGGMSETKTHDINFMLVKRISPEIVKELVWKVTGADRFGNDTGIGWEGVTFPSLESLDLATARALVDNPLLPTIYLGMDTRFESPEVAELLLKNDKIKTFVHHYVQKGRMPESERERYDVVTFNATEMPAWQLAYILKKNPAIGNIDFSNLKTFDEGFVDALTTYEGALEFNKLESVDLELLQKLCTRKETLISLGGIKTIDPAFVSAIAPFRGTIILRSVRALDIPTAKALVKTEARSIMLSNLEDLEPEVAKILVAMGRRLGVGYGKPYHRMKEARGESHDE